MKTRWKVLWEITTPRESEIWVFFRQHLATLAIPTIRSIKCKQSPVYGVFDRYIRIPLPIVTKHELGLPFPLGTFPYNLVQIRNSVHNPFSYRGHRQTHTQTDTQTNVGKTYPLAFAGRTRNIDVMPWRAHSVSTAVEAAHSCCMKFLLYIHNKSRIVPENYAR